MSHNPLDEFTKRNDFLIGIDSDGCAFDSMEIKHKECFIPNFIKYMDLQPVSKYAREACEFTNLYSKSRGANRFLSYLAALGLLEHRQEVLDRGAKILRLQTLRDWVARQQRKKLPLGNPTLQQEVARTGDDDLARGLNWSLAVNEAIADMVHGVPPFPRVRDSLQELAVHADIIVCSATPNEALNKEWEEHDLARYVSRCGDRRAICGQESGSKAETLGQAEGCGYARDHVLMIGDAPGDQNAAQAVGALFYPINPGHEEASWQRFFDEARHKFLGGQYAGAYERSLIDEFETCLPETPPWQPGTASH